MFQGRTRTWENDALVNMESSHDPLRRLKHGYGTSNGVGSNSSIDLEWETAEGNLLLLQ